MNIDKPKRGIGPVCQKERPRNCVRVSNSIQYPGHLSSGKSHLAGSFSSIQPGELLCCVVSLAFGLSLQRPLTSAPIDGDWRAPHQNTVSHVDPHAPLAGLPPGEGEYLSGVMSALKGHCVAWRSVPELFILFRDLKSLVRFVPNCFPCGVASCGWFVPKMFMIANDITSQVKQSPILAQKISLYLLGSYSLDMWLWCVTCDIPMDSTSRGCIIT